MLWRCGPSLGDFLSVPGSGSGLGVPGLFLWAATLETTDHFFEFRRGHSPLRRTFGQVSLTAVGTDKVPLRLRGMLVFDELRSDFVNFSFSRLVLFSVVASFGLFVVPTADTGRARRLFSLALLQLIACFIDALIMNNTKENMEASLSATTEEENTVYEAYCIFAMM